MIFLPHTEFDELHNCTCDNVNKYPEWTVMTGYNVTLHAKNYSRTYLAI